MLHRQYPCLRRRIFLMRDFTNAKPIRAACLGQNYAVHKWAQFVALSRNITFSWPFCPLPGNERALVRLNYKWVLCQELFRIGRKARFLPYSSVGICTVL
jgi:hypothetical protein